MSKIKCNSISYRKGFVEITSNIHDGFINFEVWNIHPDTNISSDNFSFDMITDGDITGNVEIELSVENAQEVLKALESFLKKNRVRHD